MPSSITNDIVDGAPKQSGHDDEHGYVSEDEDESGESLKEIVRSIRRERIFFYIRKYRDDAKFLRR